MGNSKSKAQKAKNAQVHKLLKEAEDKNAGAYNIILLGTGQSGKTTIFHQIKTIYTQTSISDRMMNCGLQTKGIIRQNIVASVNLILRCLAKACDEGDKNCDISFLGIFKDDEKDQNISFSPYFDAFFTAAYDIQINWRIQCLVRDLDDLALGKTIRSGMTEVEIRQELNDIVENRIPPLKKTMKSRLSNVFDLDNLSGCIKLLLTYSAQQFHRFDESNKIGTDKWDNTLDNTTINMFTATTAEMTNYTSTIFDMIQAKCTDRCLENLETYGKALFKIWSELDQFRYVYWNLGANFEQNYIANMDWYFNKCLQVFNNDFVPNDDDLIRINIRTTGIVRERFDINGKLLYIADTGGQRSERKKWPICMDQDVKAVIYVAALDHFRLMLFEDSTANAMKESVDCFESILTKWDNLKAIFLILSRKDLFKQSLGQGHGLSLCFGDEYSQYKGLKCSAQYDLKILNNLMLDMLECQKDVEMPIEIVNVVYKYLGCELSLKFAYDHGIEFIKQKFLSLNKHVDRKIQIFVVNSIIVEEVEKIMEQMLDMLNHS